MCMVLGPVTCIYGHTQSVETVCTQGTVCMVLGPIICIILYGCNTQSTKLGARVVHVCLTWFRIFLDFFFDSPSLVLR